MPAKLKPIKFKIHQTTIKRVHGSTDTHFEIEVLEKSWFGWRHKSWVRYDGWSKSYEPSEEASRFYSTVFFDSAMKDVEDFYDRAESWKAVSKEKTSYIYEKNN